MGRRRPSLHPWEGTAYRASTYDVALWVRPNRRDGRWNHADTGSFQYLCLDADAPYAEMIRHEQLHTEDEAAQWRGYLYEVQLHEAAIADYSTFDKAEAAGFPPDALVDDDYDRCQAETAWLQGHGARGVLSPSAALPGAGNLTLFGPRVEVPWTATPNLAAEVPVRRVGGKGPPPSGLVERVRHFGQGHSTLDSYLEAKVKPRRARPPRR